MSGAGWMLPSPDLRRYTQAMDEHTISAFFDEFQKIALVGGQLSESSTPKTPAPTPPPMAKVAPQKSAAPPKIAPVKPAGGGLSTQASSSKRLGGFNPPRPRNPDTFRPKKTPVPNLRAVTTMPVRRPSKPAFMPGPLGPGSIPGASPF
jgi:hypothetical protein